MFHPRFQRTVCALALAGCGGSSATLDKGALAAKANTICARTNSEIGQPKTLATTKAYGPYFTKLSRVLQAEHTSISALKPAGNLHGAVLQYLDNEAKVIAALDTASAKALAGDAAGLTVAEQSSVDPGKLVLAAARTLGWAACQTGG